LSNKSLQELLVRLVEEMIR